MKYHTVLRMRAVLTSRSSAAQQTCDPFTPFKLPLCVISLPAIFWDPRVNATVTLHHPGLWVSRHAERSSLQSAETNTSNLLLAFLPFYRGGWVITDLFLLLARQCMEWSVSTNKMCWWKGTGTFRRSWTCTTHHKGTKPTDIILKLWTFAPNGLLSLCSGDFTWYLFQRTLGTGFQNPPGRGGVDKYQGSRNPFTFQNLVGWCRQSGKYTCKKNGNKEWLA